MTSKLPISLVISTKNEENNIRDCIRSAGEAFSQVLVVDSGSDDRTTQFARSMQAEVLNFSWNGEYPKKKQWILENAALTQEWVLFVDGDERLNASLLSELHELFGSRTPHCQAFDIKLSYWWRGHKLRHGYVVRKRCLLNRSNCMFPTVDDLDCPGMGELEGHYQPEVKGFIGTLAGRLDHNDRDGISEWLGRHNRYSDWEAQLTRKPNAARQVGSARSGQGRAFARTPCKPLVFLIYSYLIKGGFLDGRPGLEYALFLSFYYFVIETKTREADHSGAGPSPTRTDAPKMA